MPSEIEINAARLRELHQRIHETAIYRSESPEKRKVWENACAEFHSKYDSLAFPGGYSEGLSKIKNGDLKAVAVALEYLEHTPYCFGSQYVATNIRRAINKVILPETLASRFNQWKENQKKSRTRR